MKLSTRELVTIAVFGTLWGIMEMTLGGVLKSIDFPFSGIVLAAFGLMIAMIGRVFVNQSGSTIFIGVIAMFLKLLSLGGVIIGPMLAIFMEALLAEAVLSIRKLPGRGLMMTAGALGVSWGVIQPFITGPLLYGRAVFEVWLDFLSNTSRDLGLGSGSIFAVLAIYLLINLIVGALSGYAAWNIGKQVTARLGKRVPVNANELR